MGSARRGRRAPRSCGAGPSVPFFSARASIHPWMWGDADPTNPLKGNWSMKRLLVLLALPAVLTVPLAGTAHALADDGVQTETVEEQHYDGMSPAVQTVMAYVHAQL